MALQDAPSYPEPPLVGDEASTLLGSLERQRATFAWKCAELDATQLRVSVGASAITLGGLLKHLAYMEDLNFTHELAGHDLPPPWSTVDRSTAQGWEWRSAADDSPQQLYNLWQEAVTRARTAIAEVLAAGGPQAQYTTEGGEKATVRRLLVDMIEEYARHTGHADLIREALDGRVGEDPPGRPFPYQAPRSAGSP
ncbi:DinB family protein [Georgenia yuyongxinii]|uniref:DinB family protein n=1 Tax=Georgenia yuyongxinii TaxID=2589797 RepID=A0A552WVA6_9MICO|nr:DinB family protein [Georgenia yuyongxinii]TRW46635.1 DinB family protein [Georgenia yuyongxinii]